MTGNAPTHSTHAKRIAVLKGGFSQERDVSLVSGREIARALRTLGYHVSELDAGRILLPTIYKPPNLILFLTPYTVAGARMGVSKAFWNG